MIFTQHYLHVFLNDADEITIAVSGKNCEIDRISIPIDLASTVKDALDMVVADIPDEVFARVEAEE